MIRLRVAKSGKILKLTITGDRPLREAVGKCIEKAVAGARMPPHHKDYRVDYPVIFKKPR